MRYFGGLTLEETASVAGISLAIGQARMGHGARLVAPRAGGVRSRRDAVTPERWSAVKALFSAALELPREERAGVSGARSAVVTRR